MERREFISLAAAVSIGKVAAANPAVVLINGQTFREETVDVNGKVFLSCTFVRCRMKWRGSLPAFPFADCLFDATPMGYAQIGPAGEMEFREPQANQYEIIGCELHLNDMEIDRADPRAFDIALERGGLKRAT